MDGECASILPRVCTVLAASGGSLADDTSLEKLLDWFTTMARTGVSLLEACPYLLDFLSEVAFNSAPAPSILSFTLKLTGLIGSSEDGFKVLETGSVLKLFFDPHRWLEAGLWEDPCLRIGWIQGLNMILQHSEALKFFVQADLIEPLLQLQTDSSLFVASAANQTLVHVLLLDRSAVGCNGTSKRNSEHSSVGMEDGQNCSGIITKVSEYLSKSLLLKDTSQILQLLKLLLVQVRPPLQDALLLALIDPLEELVTQSCSQLTLYLMDVLLAANSLSSGRVPQQRISRLLSFMLSRKQPADILQAAAAVLRCRPIDPAHSAHSTQVLLLPLDIVSGISLLDRSSTAEELRTAMTEQLKSKTCVSMICVCLTNLAEITLMAPDSLPGIVSAVLTLLRLSRVDSTSSSSSAGCVEVVRFVTGSSKVQKCALEALSALSRTPDIKMELVEVFKVLSEHLNSPSSDPAVLQKSYQALVNWTNVSSDLSFITDQLREELLQAVRKRACDVRWEARDSTVEFLGQLAGPPCRQTSNQEETEPSDALLGGRGVTVPLLKEALQDPESYVRASSISALAQTLALGWQQGAAMTQEQVEIVSRLQEVLSQDSEGFARRAVLKYFIAWFSSCSSPAFCPLLMRSVPTVLSRGLADLDWEVKLHSLELAELLLGRTFPDPAPPHPYAATPRPPLAPDRSDLLAGLNALAERGVVSALLRGLADCDRPVALKACQLLLRLREAVRPLTEGAADVMVSCDPSLMQEIRDVQAREEDSSCAAPVALRAGLQDGGPTRVGVCEALRWLDLDGRLSVLSQSSDHVYNSPLSLLQDILTASQPHSEPGQEVIVDCY